MTYKMWMKIAIGWVCLDSAWEFYRATEQGFTWHHALVMASVLPLLILSTATAIKLSPVGRWQ